MTRRRAMARTPARIPLFLLDGFGPDYLRAAEMPRLTAWMRAGASTLQGSGVVPSLTNVNHVSLLTGTYPERHGLCANFYCDRGSGREVFMDEVTFVRSPLLFETVKALAWSTALVAGKAKLARPLGRGLDWSFDMDHVPADLAPVVGPPPEIFSMEINLWVLRLAREVPADTGPGSSTWRSRTIRRTCGRPAPRPCRNTLRPRTSSSAGSWRSTTSTRRWWRSRRTTG